MVTANLEAVFGALSSLLPSAKSQIIMLERRGTFFPSPDSELLPEEVK
jgi:hypothetical protein